MADLTTKAYLWSNKEHVVRDVVYSSNYGSESYSWEDVGIVTLARVEHLVIEGDGVEGATTCKHSPALQQNTTQPPH